MTVKYWTTDHFQILEDNCDMQFGPPPPDKVEETDADEDRIKEEESDPGGEDIKVDSTFQHITYSILGYTNL